MLFCASVLNASTFFTESFTVFFCKGFLVIAIFSTDFFQQDQVSFHKVLSFSKCLVISDTTRPLRVSRFKLCTTHNLNWITLS